MPGIFEEYQEIVASKTEEYQVLLKVRIEKFEQDLAIYAKYCDELQYWGNIEEIRRYRKKAINLDNKLVAAMDTIDEFNEEERLFGWELSQYPMRKKVSRLIEKKYLRNKKKYLFHEYQKRIYLY